MKKIFTFLSLLCLLGLFVSCGDKTTGVEDPAANVVQENEIPEELKELRNSVIEKRTFCEANGGPSVDNLNWSKAEESFAAAEKVCVSNKDVAKEEYTNALHSYELVYAKIIAKTNLEIVEKGYVEERISAVKAGAETLFPQYLASVDNDFKTLLDSYPAKAAEPLVFYDEINEFRVMYKALTLLCKSAVMFNEIEQQQLEVTEDANYADAKVAYSRTEGLFETESEAKDVYAEAEKCYSSLCILLDSFYLDRASSEKEKAVAEKEKAESIKAPVAAKDAYNNAVKTLNQADTAYDNGKGVSAYEGYISATDSFQEVYSVVIEKRTRAEAALQRVRQKNADAESMAQRADTLVPLEESMPVEETVEEEE